MAEFMPGQKVVIKPSGDVAEVVAVSGNAILVRRASGAQSIKTAADLLPHGVCSI